MFLASAARNGYAKGMNRPCKFGLVVGLIAAFATVSDPALAKKDPAVGKPPPTFYRDDVRCVERSFSISVGNPAYKNRMAYWPAPCGR